MTTAHLLYHFATEIGEKAIRLDSRTRQMMNIATVGMNPYGQYPRFRPHGHHPWGSGYKTYPELTRPGIAVIGARVAPLVATAVVSEAVATDYIAPMMGESLQEATGSTTGLGGPQTQPTWLAVPYFFLGLFW